MAAVTGVAVARHGSRRGGRHRQRHRVRLCGGRGRVAGRAGRGVERTRRTAIRRWTQLGAGAADSDLAQSGALRARRTDRQGAVVERQSDRIVESLQRTHRCQRPCLYRDLRRRPLLLWCATLMVNKSRILKSATPFAVLLAAATLHGQVGRGTTEWLTAGGDAQRTFWIRTDPKISVAAMSEPGFERQWSAKLDNKTRGANGLAHGVTANGVTLFVPMSIVAGSSNNVYALDNDTGYVVWQRHFDAPLAAPTAQCPGGMTAGATRIVPLMPP